LRRSPELERSPPGQRPAVGADCVRPGRACACRDRRNTFNFFLLLSLPSPLPSPGRTQWRPYGIPLIRGCTFGHWSESYHLTTQPKSPPGQRLTVGADCVRPGRACACRDRRNTFNFFLLLSLPSPLPSPGRTQWRPYGIPSVRGGKSVFWSGPDRATTHPKSPPGRGHSVGADCVRPGRACTCGCFRSTFNFPPLLSLPPSPGRTQWRPYGIPLIRGCTFGHWSESYHLTTQPEPPPGQHPTVGADCVRPDAKGHGRAGSTPLWPPPVAFRFFSLCYAA
jgi:hypothetical protein